MWWVFIRRVVKALDICTDSESMAEVLEKMKPNGRSPFLTGLRGEGKGSQNTSAAKLSDSLQQRGERIPWKEYLTGFWGCGLNVEEAAHIWLRCLHKTGGGMCHSSNPLTSSTVWWPEICKLPRGSESVCLPLFWNPETASQTWWNFWGNYWSLTM